MPNVSKYDQTGKKAGEFSLEDAVFSDRVRVITAQELLLLQLSNKRRANAKTLDRTEVRGGGRKPYRQKGTGRARCGSTRSPVRTGGAVAMGPSGEPNYTLKMPKKARRAAVRSILTDKVRKGQLFVIENVKFDEPKTKRIIELLKTMDVGTEKVLFVIDERNYNFECSVRNIPNAKALVYSNLNPHDLMYHGRVVMFENAVSKVTKTLVPRKKVN